MQKWKHKEVVEAFKITKIGRNSFHGWCIRGDSMEENMSCKWYDKYLPAVGGYLYCSDFSLLNPPVKYRPVESFEERYMMVADDACELALDNEPRPRIKSIEPTPDGKFYLVTYQNGRWCNVPMAVEQPVE